MSRNDPDPPRALVIYVPLTTQNRNSAYEILLPKLNFLAQDSVANVQGIGSIPRVRFERKLGELPNQVMAQIKQAIMFALDLKVDEQVVFLLAIACLSNSVVTNELYRKN